jgi:Leucine-rich repeat (LRR) protein
LVLSECDLVSLDNLPQLGNLEELDLSTNSLADEEIKKISIYKKLVSLNIADNKITKLETVKSLKEAMKNLEVLECADNDIESLPDYFKTVFKTFPQLKSLDNKDKNGKEIEPAEYQDFE